MKKVLFLMILPFLLLGTASVSAQVRIGGSGTPHNAAVLDLNADDVATPSGNRGGLALPRVELATVTMELNNTAPINGMLVYNTGGTLAIGVYVWMTDKWVKASTGSVAYESSESIILDGTSFKRSALTGDVIADENKNNTTIKDGAVTSAKILDKTITGNDISDGAITSEKLGSMGATAGQALIYTDDRWSPADLPGGAGGTGSASYVLMTRPSATAWPFEPNLTYSLISCSSGASPLLPVTYVEDGSYYNGYRMSGLTFYGTVLCTSGNTCTCLFQTF